MSNNSALNWGLLVVVMAALIAAGVWSTSRDSGGETNSSSITAEAETTDSGDETELDPDMLTTSMEVWTAWEKLTEDQASINEEYDEINERDDVTREEIEDLKGRMWAINREVNEKYNQHFEKALEEHPDNAFNHMSYAYYLFPRDREQAWEHYERAVELDRRPEFLGLWATLLTRQLGAGGHSFVSPLSEDTAAENGEHALELFEEASELDPENGILPLRNAITQLRLWRQDLRDEPSGEVIYELVKQANEAGDYYFVLPPPVPYKMRSWERAWTDWEDLGDLARPTNLRGVFTDFELEMTYNKLLDYYRNSNNADALLQMNDMLRNAAMAKPFDRTFLKIHVKMGTEIMEEIEEKYPDRVEAADVSTPRALYLEAQEDIWNELIRLGYRPSSKPNNFDVGLWEKNWERDLRLYDYFYPEQKRVHNHLQRLIRENTELDSGEGQ